MSPVPQSPTFPGWSSPEPYLPTYLQLLSSGRSHHLQRQAYLRLGDSYHHAGDEGPAKLTAVGMNCPRHMKLRSPEKTAVLPAVLAEASPKRTTNVKERYTDPVVLSRLTLPTEPPQGVSTSGGYRAPKRRRLQLKKHMLGETLGEDTKIPVHNILMGITICPKSLF